jgi:anti-sigma regulatory factor (Ser/Thr protein kinase)
VCYSLTLRLPSEPGSVPEGRRRLAEALDAWGVTDADPFFPHRGEILLLATELLANAVRASQEEVVLSVETHRDSVRIDVTDDSPHPARRREAADRELSGRGLTLVAALSDEWGQSEFNGKTKDVWGVVGVPAGSALAAGCRL